ncbi:hypothetical protein C8R47DRAFT_1092519 [Mycena vitilis]|nr:hypothetical protein C8R47DRAFT_1092519 [Mycena vitilis]
MLPNAVTQNPTPKFSRPYPLKMANFSLHLPPLTDALGAPLLDDWDAVPEVAPLLNPGNIYIGRDVNAAMKTNLPAITIIVMAWSGSCPFSTQEGACGGAKVQNGRWVPADSGTLLALMAHIKDFHPTTIILDLTLKSHPSIEALRGQNLASFRDAICLSSGAPRWALAFAPPAPHRAPVTFKDAIASLYRRALAQNVCDQRIAPADATQRAAREVPRGIESIPAFRTQDDSFAANLKLLYGGPVRYSKSSYPASFKS